MMSPGFVQAETSSDYHNELLQNYRTYQSLLDPFYTQRSRHQTHGTVSTQAELLAATRSLIETEVKAIASYTNFINSYLSEASAVLGLSQESLTIKLKDEIDFLVNAEAKAKNLSSLAEGKALLKEINQHYNTITGFSYQVQSIIKFESSKRVYSNLKIEKEKLNNYLSQNTSENYQALAAREKFQALDLKMNLIEKTLEEIEKKVYPDANMDNKEIDWKKTYSGINNKTKEIVSSFNKIILGYQNIVFSLK
ncbi:MAG: hypothetical protein ACOX50_04095 [Patescibacteria group bacterium]